MRGYCSYGWNTPIMSDDYDQPVAKSWGAWRPQDIKHAAANIPQILDSAWQFGFISGFTPPPSCDAVPIFNPVPWTDNSFCMNRHDGSVNGLFLDWSARKVGLKELWTLKWHKRFDTRGPWTRAGGVQAEDWPQWMRRFKDY